MLRKLSNTGVTYQANALSKRSWWPLAALPAHSANPRRKCFSMGSIATRRSLSNVAGSSVDPEQPMKKEPRKWARSRISTLNPSEYKAQDILDLSSARVKYLSFAAREWGCNITYRGDGAHHRATGKTEEEPFPPNTKGVFYFHDRSSVHPIAGDVRFRVLPVDEVQDWGSVDTVDLFARGHDLVDYSGFGPWSISLIHILRKGPKTLRDFMKTNGYISEAAEEQMRLFSSTGKQLLALGGEHIVEKVTDPFVLDLSKPTRVAIFLQREGITPVQINLWRWVGRHLPPGIFRSLYSGIVLVRFEAVSARVGRKQELYKKVVIRVLKFLEPPNPSDLVVQQEGELLKQYSHRDKAEKPWMGKALKSISPSSLALLEETYLPADAQGSGSSTRGANPHNAFLQVFAPNSTSLLLTSLQTRVGAGMLKRCSAGHLFLEHDYIRQILEVE